MDEESAAVRLEIRVERLEDAGLEESGSESGSGSVSMRAILQALAPRSRTCGKCLLISY